ncbi:uncharacterized protein LOC115438607 isoform X4 [Sphaeramia orbicularis]|uniref:uncharacterized protein LOC115438607 isoform X4 n=1 Tax=Sphaeramia orbicularis TaxID=375764 RepID=UPI00117DAA6E|nr:uncharacterized protein LOC115438607 isoform X4 [Sphaeramia orbicularis]
MFWLESEGGPGPVATESRSKADVLRGVVTDRLSTAVREILAVVETTVAEYEEEAAGFRQEIDRQRQALRILLESQVKIEPANVCPGEQQLCPVRGVKEEEEAGGAENPEQDGHLWNDQQLCPVSERVPVERLVNAEEARGKENPEQDQHVWGEQLVNQLHPESQDVLVKTPGKIAEEGGGRGGESPEDDEHMSYGEFENLGLVSYIEDDDDDEGEELPPLRCSPKQKNKRPRPLPRSGTRTSLRLRMNDPKEFIQLRLCVLPDPHITGVSHSKLLAYPTMEVSCPVGLQQEEFLNLLRVTFPQINNNPFDLFWTDNGRKLLPLHVETLTAEEIQRNLNNTNQPVYIRLQGEVESNVPAVSSRPVTTHTTKIRFVARSRARKGTDNGQDFIDLEILIPDDSDVGGQSSPVKSSKQVKVVRCPLGLKEEDFLSQLKSLFPQLAGNEIIELFQTNHGSDLVPLNTTTLTPEEIWKSISADGPGSTLCVQKKMDSRPDVSDHLHNSDETIMKETCNEVSPNNHSNKQSDDEVVPSLSCTKSILVDREQEFAGCLHDSGDNCTPGTSISKPERHSQRLTRSSHRPMNLVESDDSSIESEDEYIPCPLDESTESDSSLELTLEAKKKNKGASIESRSKSSTQSKLKPMESGSESSRQRRSKSSSHDPTQKFPNSRVDGNEKKIVAKYSKKDESVSESLEEEPSVYVSPVLKDGSRSYNKKHFCFYCRKFVQKMSRHLWLKHQDETDVVKALSLPKNSKERKQQLEYICNKGNFKHNNDVLETQKGKLIPWKQPQRKSEREEFAHCVHCYGLFTKRSMWRHLQACRFKPERTNQSKTSIQAIFAEPTPPGFSDAYRKFLSVMNQDMIALAIVQDRCILEYGYRLFKKNENIVSNHQHIRQKLRDLGRLFLEARKVTHMETMQELLKPEHFCHVVTAAKSLSGFNEQTGKYQHPSLARKVGHSLRSVALFIKSGGLKKKDKQATQDAEEFLRLYRESWRFDIANQALTHLDQSKWNTPQLLPFTEDIQKLHCHLAEKQQQHLNDLREHPSPSNWKELAKVTLTQVLLFNRRREEEVSRMLLSAFLSKDTSDTHGDVSLALTPLEQKLCKHFVRVTIAENGGRNVPVLLTPLMSESLDVLTKKRDECGVLCENKYLFALPDSVHYIRASNCVRQFVKECDDIKNPEAVTSTKLRKHIATVSTVLNLKTTELDQFADFLGHNIAVNRKHYHLREGTRHLAKISKVLLAMEQGHLGEYKGKSLDEIQVGVNETIGMEELSEEEAEDVSMSRKQGSEDVVSSTSLQECTSTSQVQKKEVSAKKRGKQRWVKRWTPEEIAAVEKHLKKFVERQDVPGKADCERCISAEPQALQKRDWKAIKYFIHNRITAMRRKL